MAFRRNRRASDDDDRYDGRPFLVLLENYVLWCGDRLDAEALSNLETMNLQQVFSAEASDWFAVIEEQMEFDQALRDQIAAMWAENVALARDAGHDLDDVAFARAVADRLSA